MRIKVCGMREAENILQLLALKPDYMGFIFYEGSQRFVSEKDALETIEIPETIRKTGVFVNASELEIENKIRQYRLGAVQLHGNESPETCSRLKGEQVEIIKAFGIDEQFDFKILKNYEGRVDYFLFDTKTSGHGGSGKVFDWKILEQYELDIPYFLSGGLSIENLNGIKDFVDKRLYALDLNSKFETAPGMKDINKVRTAIEMIRSWTERLH